MYAVLLPILLFAPPRMAGAQPVNIVWVDTSKETWTENGKTDTRRAIRDALDWWEGKAEVSFQTAEYTLTIDLDVLALNSCRERGWLSDRSGLTLYMVATRERWLACDGVAVADAGILGDGRIVVAGMTSYPYLGALIAHAVAHLYMAGDGHHAPRTFDIMDRDYLIQAWLSGFVGERTMEAMGATRRVVGLVHRASARVRLGQRAREVRASYLLNACVQGFRTCHYYH